MWRRSHSGILTTTNKIECYQRAKELERGGDRVALGRDPVATLLGRGRPWKLSLA